MTSQKKYGRLKEKKKVMNKNITIINMEDSERIRVTVHSEDSIKLVKLLADAGFIDYNFEDNIYDTNDYSAES